MIETQFNKKVKTVRRDNGLELTSTNMQRFYKEKGITMELTCTYTPQPNGVVERKHRHILVVARALRFHSGLPIHFWGECILTAVYIINRLPSKAINNRTPYEIMLGKKLDYANLKVFCCLVYALKKRREGKFDERGGELAFL